MGLQALLTESVFSRQMPACITRVGDSRFRRYAQYSDRRTTNIYLKGTSMRNLRGYAGLLCAALLIVPVSESLAGKPGGGAPQPPDCSSISPNWSGFPSFAYVLQNARTATYEVRVASQNGLCSKRVGDAQSGWGESLSFAVNGGQYVVAWLGGGGIHVVSFALGGPLETVSTIPALITTFRTSACCSVDLSADASSIAYTKSQPPPAQNELRIATLGNPDDTGASDQVTYRFNAFGAKLWWAPWGRIYVQEANGNSKRLGSIDPGLTADAQLPITLLTFAPSTPLKLGELYELGSISGGYSAFGNSEAAVVFQGRYLTKVKESCTAVYALDADSGAWALGELASPSSIRGYAPSVTERGTVLVENVSGPNCVRTGQLSEWPLSSLATASILGTIPGVFPAALKRLP